MHMASGSLANWHITELDESRLHRHLLGTDLALRNPELRPVKKLPYPKFFNCLQAEILFFKSVSED